MPLLFNPKFVGREHDPITGESRQNFKLENLDKLGIEYEVRSLPYGDYIIQTIDEHDDPIIDIKERKTVADLIGSFASASMANKGKIRIDDQITRCLEGRKNYDNARVTLLIEDFYEVKFDFSDEGLGVWIPYKISYSTSKKDRSDKPVYSFASYSKRLINPTALLAKIDAIRARGVQVVLCGGAHHAYKHVIDLMTKVPDDKKIGVKAIRQKPSRMSINDQILFFLQGIPGIAGTFSLELLKRRPVPIDLLNWIAGAQGADDIGIPQYGDMKFSKSKTLLTTAYDFSIEKPKSGVKVQPVEDTGESS
jgi:ERCC4-type nuclease